MQIAAAFTLCILFATPSITAAPSQEVTDRLIAELQDIRKSLARDSIEIFENQKKLADMPNPPALPWWDTEAVSPDGWLHEKLCRAIVNEDKPVTDLNLLVDDVGRIAGSLKGVMLYTYSQEAERILRLQLYYNRFAHAAIPYIDACRTHKYLLKDNRDALDDSASEERTFISETTRTITTSNRIEAEGWLDSFMYRFSGVTCDLPKPPTHIPHASAPAAEFHKRTISDDSDSEDIVTKNPKRARVDDHDSDDDNDNDTQAAQPVAPTIPMKPGLLAILRSHAHDTNIIRKRSNIMAHDGFRDHYLKTESQALAHTLPRQTPVKDQDGLICANNAHEVIELHRIVHRLRKSISDAEEITQSGSFMLSTAQKICSNISDLEANHVNTYAKNVARIKQWQTHYQNVLNMGLLYLKGITVENPDHIAQRDRLINRFTQDLGVDIIPTLPPENPASTDTDIQKIMDLQRITLANKTTHALAGIQKIQALLEPQLQAE
jgi:hypothetical protein